MNTAPLYPNARVTGLVYLCYFLTAVIGLSLDKHNFNVAGHIVDGVSIACYLAVSILFFYLFKPVNIFISLLAAVLSVTGCVLTAFSTFHIADTISPLLFFGPYCILLGYLIIRSAFLPKLLGICLVMAGIGWLILLLHPYTTVASFIKAFGFLAELSFMLWLLIKGGDSHDWNQQKEE